MIFKERLAGNPQWWGLLLLVLGILIGNLATPFSVLRQTVRESLQETRLNPRLLPKMVPPEPAGNDLPTLYLDFSPEGSRIIQRVRDRAMDRGVIIQEPSDTVTATVKLENRILDAEVRIKGDWTDHVKTEKWSFRISFKNGKLFGMRAFSIQNPYTRGYLWEWLVHKAARREDILAPRSLFINLVINNNRAGVYFLEEHFAKELVESGKRREGPIVLFDESTLWTSYLQHHIGAQGFHPKVPAPLKPTMSPQRASVRAYGEKRLTATEPLNRELVSALRKMEGIRNKMIAASSNKDKLAQMTALEALQDQTIEDLFDTDSWARAHALASLFQIWHGLTWNNMRLYFNPVTDRLEPIMFDNMAHNIRSQEPVIFRPTPMIRELAGNRTYYQRFFHYLGRYSDGAFLDEFFKEVEDSFHRYARALDQEAKLYGRYRPDAMKQRLRAQQIYLKNFSRHDDPINFAGFFRETSSGTTVEGVLEVKAWATTRLPVALAGFRFSNGVFLSARSCLEGSEAVSATDGTVSLPFDGRPLLFHFPADRRLASLSNIQQINSAIRENETGKGGLKLDEITAVYRLFSESEEREELVHFRPYKSGWEEEVGRPALPSLKEALARYPFLTYDLEKDTLSLATGEWKVDGDLLVPRGHVLHAAPGLILRFEEGAVLFSETPLIFKGRKDKPVVFEPAKGAASWGGIVVLKAPGRSQWEQVKVRKTNVVTRNGWMTTGGITFYHSPVTMRDCLIDGAVAEDGLNIFGTDLLLERVSFTACLSDSFDGDFVTGAIRDCVFKDGRADGVDFSGSDVTLTGCRFLNLGDKAISVGEKSVCRISGGLIDGAPIGIASKDLSRVTVQNMAFRAIGRFAFAVFIKKPEFGPSKVVAEQLDLKTGLSNPFLVQTGCELLLDGVPMPTREIDVARMYHEKILGN